jgi:hypothetical protein
MCHHITLQLTILKKGAVIKGLAAALTYYIIYNMHYSEKKAYEK